MKANGADKADIVAILNRPLRSPDASKGQVQAERDAAARRQRARISIRLAVEEALEAGLSAEECCPPSEAYRAATLQAMVTLCRYLITNAAHRTRSL